MEQVTNPKKKRKVIVKQPVWSATPGTLEIYTPKQNIKTCVNSLPAPQVSSWGLPS